MKTIMVNQVRVIVYEMQDNKEEVFEIDSVEMEQVERQVADFAKSQGDCVDYHFEWREE